MTITIVIAQLMGNKIIKNLKGKKGEKENTVALEIFLL